MATTLGIYKDSALTTLLTSVDAITNNTVHQQVFVGSPTVGLVHRRKTLPGTNELQLSIVDNSGADDVAVTNFKLALTEAGLATAVAGAPLNLGTSITSGTAGALSVWIGYTDTAGKVVNVPAAVNFTVLDVEDATA